MIVGATPTPDSAILDTASTLYHTQRLRRVYYSAFSPIPDASPILPASAPPLVREHRLYQADWLMRFYGFQAAELTEPQHPNLDLEVDPKLGWALRNPAFFPLAVDTAPRESLLRIPGVGVRSVDKILKIRRWHRVRVADLLKLRVPLSRVLPFVELADHRPSRVGPHLADLRSRVVAPQLDLFAAGRMAHAGEL